MPRDQRQNHFKRRPSRFQTPAKCFFCSSTDEQREPNYKDVEVLHRFISDRSKIVPRDRSGLCAKHQRRVSQAIKRARYLALLPFVAEI